ncbi:hypothetical protein BS50DRAFT_593409 [Corynespora cassiicola Philippines]|uniref:Uncharacterized protein n=1 Tax=Corynespora cassiicola Philippines TaxID=1448308 RepID=A0A2T2N6P4_CORCC|nr:hypothetical protein BS50DRAFT_593409 [Corynespora cassiicola Philippines]
MAQGCAIAGFGVFAAPFDPLQHPRPHVMVSWPGLSGGEAWPWLGDAKGRPGEGDDMAAAKKGARRADKWTGRLVHSTLLWKTNGAERARSGGRRLLHSCTAAQLRLPLCTRAFLSRALAPSSLSPSPPPARWCRIDAAGPRGRRRHPGTDLPDWGASMAGWLPPPSWQQPTKHGPSTLDMAFLPYHPTAPSPCQSGTRTPATAEPGN